MAMNAFKSIKSQVCLLQTDHSWANAGVLLGGRVRRGTAFETIKLCGHHDSDPQGISGGLPG